MFRIYSGIDQSAHLQSSSSGFEVNCRRLVSKLAEIHFPASLQVLDLLWSEIKLEMIVAISLNYWRIFRCSYTVVSTRSDHNIHQLYSWTGNNVYYSDVMLPLWISDLKWNNICCYTEQFATRNILKQLHISENSFPRRGIFLPDLQSMCRSLNIRF